jgi:hypothetical protein
MEHKQAAAWVLAALLAVLAPAPAEGGVAAAFKTVTMMKEEPDHTVKAQYPQFRAGKIPEGAVNKLNSAIEDLVRRASSDALEDCFAGNDYLEHHRHEDALARTRRSDHIKYEVIRADARYVSLKFERYHYEEGGAHGLTVIFTFNYDIARRRVMRLGDLFSPGTQYLYDLSAACIGSLLGQLGEGDVSRIVEGAMPQEKNLGVFTISGEELVIYFQYYQVAPYSAGPPRVAIPFERLEGLRLKG